MFSDPRFVKPASSMELCDLCHPFQCAPYFRRLFSLTRRSPPPLGSSVWRSSFNLHPIFRSLVLLPPTSNAPPTTLPNLPRSQCNLLSLLKCLRGCERMPPSVYAADQRASTSAISDIFISFLHNGSRSVVYEIKRLKRKSLD